MNRDPRQYAALFFDLTKDQSSEMIERILSEYRALVKKSGKSLEIEVRTIEPLSEEMKKKIRVKIHAPENAEVKEIIDPSLIGGVVAIYHDQQIDLSLKGKLLRLKESMRKGV